MKKNNQNVGTVPLVFALHGYGGSSMSMIPWEKVAEEFGFILVRPQGKFLSMLLSMLQT